jgi:hypothetical protein
MGTINKLAHRVMAVALATATVHTAVGSTSKVGGPPRGADVSARAGGCGIGPFPQTAKAGEYNALCATMQDAEKCLAFIKGHFEPSGAVNPAEDTAKMEYCLETLARDLGVSSAL